MTATQVWAPALGDHCRRKSSEKELRTVCFLRSQPFLRQSFSFIKKCWQHQWSHITFTRGSHLNYFPIRFMLFVHCLVTQWLSAGYRFFVVTHWQNNDYEFMRWSCGLYRFLNRRCITVWKMSWGWSNCLNRCLVESVAWVYCASDQCFRC